MKRLLWATAVLVAIGGLICGCGGITYNPTPSINALFPPDITAGSQAFTLFVGGINFQYNTTAQWNGVNRPTYYNESTDQLAVTILDGDVASGGSGQLTVGNPAPGGGINPTAVSFAINNASATGPVITALSPSTAVAGSNADFTLTITGNNLASTDQITWNGTTLATAAPGSPVTQLTATVTSDLVSATGTASVAVQTSTPGIASPSWKFPIGPATNPSPRLGSLSPATAKIGVLPPGSYLLVNGSGFVPSSVVEFNGSPRPTGYSTSTQLAVGVLPSDVATGGTVAVTVVNPVPGGGSSSVVNFSIQ